jgi:surface-anchored protein
MKDSPTRALCKLAAAAGAILVGLITLAAPASFAQSLDPSYTLLDVGHLDTSVRYDMGTNSLRIVYQHQGSVYETHEALWYLKDPEGRLTSPGGIYETFTGAAAGEPLWIFPQTQNNTLLWPGFGLEDPSVSTLFTQVRFELVGVQGFASSSAPGEFALWTQGGIGNPTVWMSTVTDSFNGTPVPDAYTIAGGGHSHMNWGFDSLGVYGLQMRAVGTLAGGGTVTSDIETIFVGVGQLPTFSSVVPEVPSLFLAGAILAGGAVPGGIRQWTRRRKVRR